MTSQEIRRQFIDFFVQKHAHTFVPSSPVVPQDDPTLLFTNAGMNQFKPIFLGQEKRSYVRAANTQKCIRAGGKHNDLDDVGRSRRHGTFFEMLGNWSFGDYFKRGAIEMAWELLTKVWKMDPSRLHVTCFEGDEKNGVPRDTEAAEIWKEVAGLHDDQIHYFGKDNFWEMGETGPCGPCSEIYIDRTADKTGGKDVNGEDPRVMEFWNLVFIQYNRNPDRSLTPLPAQHVDTGMGFERICSILQDKDNMYGIDLFDPFFNALTDLTGFKYAGKFPKTNAADPVAEAADAQLRHDIAFRVIADHLRTLTFALTDGAVPSNEGRGYVLRRILRRAVRFGRQQLDLREPFMHKLVPVVVDSMGGTFPELKKNPLHVAELIREEEVSFGKTLDRGIELFENAAFTAVVDTFNQKSSQSISRGGDVYMGPVGGGKKLSISEAIAHWKSERTYPLNERRQIFLVRAEGAVIDLNKPERVFTTSDFGPHLFHSLGIPAVQIGAEHAFKLHDTYGFPIDLTRIMAEERGMSVDVAGYEKLMEEAREKARAGGKGGDARLFELPPDVLATLQQRGVSPTDDSYKFNAQPIGATVKAIWDGKRLIESTHGAEAAGQGVALILDQTCFYAEMGGQVGDSGELRGSKNSVLMAVETTRAAAGFVLHVGNIVGGHLTVGDHVTATLAGVRPRTEQNHTATHLANWALREVLGEGVQQKGSLVDPDKLRFDFSHGKSMSDDELARTEKLVNELIAKKLTVYAEVAPQEQALKIDGLRAVFGEKYPPMVRVVSIGAPVADLLKNPSDSKWRQFSVEFCGGTHLKNSSDVKAFVITGEESVSKGIRRIVALTGESAASATSQSREVLAALEKARALPEPQLPTTLNALQKQLGGEGIPLTVKRSGQAAIADLQAKHRAWEKAQQKSAGAAIDVASITADLLEKSETRGGGKIVVAAIDSANDEQLRAVIDSVKKRSPSFAAMVAASDGTKVSFVAAVSDDLIAKGLKAGDWIRETAKVAGGGGGGRPQMAQAGGKDPSKLSDALEIAKKYAAALIP